MADKEDEYRFFTIQDSLLLVGSNYRYCYPLDSNSISKEYLRIVDYNIKVIEDTIYVTKTTSPHGQILRYIFTLRDTLYIGKDLISDSTTHIIQRNYYNEKSLRIKTINFDSHTSMPQSMILYHFNNKNMLVCKEIFEKHDDCMINKVQYFYLYDRKENLSFVLVDFMSNKRPRGGYRYMLYSFDYDFFSKKLSKKYMANYDNGQRLFFNPDY